MDNVKKHHVLIIIVLAVLIILFFRISSRKENDSLFSFGLSALTKTDCSSFKNSNIISPVTISFNAPNVSMVQGKIKVLVAKYNGHIKNQSFSSYPSSTPDAPDENASIEATFDSSQDEFLAELSEVVKTSGGVNNGYNYNDGSSTSQYGEYSSYSSCMEMMETVSTDAIQLETLTRRLEQEHNKTNISLLSQSIYNTKTTLKTDVNNANNFFATSGKPSVSISIYTLKK